MKTPLSYLISVLACFVSSSALAEFDSGTAERLGISKESLLLSQKYFPQGNNYIDVYVNGQHSGLKEVDFLSNNNVCFTKELLASINVNSEGMSRLKERAGSCFDLKSAFPETVITPELESNRLNIVLPLQAFLAGDNGIRVSSHDTYNTVSINYTANGIYGDNKAGYLSTISGANIGKMVLRSEDSFSYNNSFNNLTKSHLNSSFYAQRNINDDKQTIMLGKIIPIGLLNALPATYGVSVFDDALLNNKFVSNIIQGSVETSSAVVQLSQMNRIIYNQTLPAGPFELKNINLVNSSTDIKVQITESNGKIREYVVSPNSYRNGKVQPSMNYLNAGRVASDNYNPKNSNAYYISAESGFSITRNAAFNYAGIISNEYQSIAVGLAFNMLNNTVFSVDSHSSKSAEFNGVGTKNRISLTSGFFDDAFILTSFYSLQNKKYRELYEYCYNDFCNESANYGFSLSSSLAGYGIFSASYNKASYIQKNNWGEYPTVNDNNYSLRYSKSFNNGSNFSVVLFDGTLRHEKSLYLTFSIPFGSSSSLSSYYDTGSDGRLGMSYSSSSLGDTSYSVSAEKGFDENYQGVHGNITSNLHYTSINLNGSTSNFGSNSVSSQLSGAVVATGDGIIFSPYRVDDTFSIIDAGVKESGIKLSTPAGPVWTSSNGLAVSSRNNPFSSNRVEVSDDNQAEFNFNYPVIEFVPARGQVNKLNIQSQKRDSRTYYLRDKDGSFIPKGTAVYTKNGNYLTLVLDDGLIYIEEPETLIHLTGEKGKCAFYLNNVPNSSQVSCKVIM